jgi:hypothetical protein
MASLKVVRADGTESIHEITPAIEYAFEQYAKVGFYRAFREQQLQTHIYWLAWECLRRADAADVFPFGDKFLGTLKAVEVLGDDSPNG